jgi:flagellar protein FliS
MNNRDIASTYKQAAIESAPPIKIVRLLYEGAIRNLERARRLDVDTEMVAFTDLVLKADAIVSELRLCLDPKPNPEVAEQLTGLYLFCEGELTRALGDEDTQPIEGVLRVLRTLLEAWKQVEVASEAA